MTRRIIVVETDPDLDLEINGHTQALYAIHPTKEPAAQVAIQIIGAATIAVEITMIEAAVLDIMALEMIALEPVAQHDFAHDRPAENHNEEPGIVVHQRPNDAAMCMMAHDYPWSLLMKPSR